MRGPQGVGRRVRDRRVGRSMARRCADGAAGLRRDRRRCTGTRVVAGSRSGRASRDLGWRAWLLEHCEGGVELLRLHAPGPTRRGLALRPGPHTGFAARGQYADDAGRELGVRAARAPGRGSRSSLARSVARSAARHRRKRVRSWRRLDATVVDRGWSLMALDAERWLVGTRDAIECTTSTPWEAAGRDSPHAPAAKARDARLVRAVMNEMQMILHEHPVNQRRDSARRQAGQRRVALGFWCDPRRRVRSLPVLATDDDWLRELWQLHGNACPADRRRRAARARQQWPILH